MVQDCIRVDVHLESTISTTFPFPQFSRGVGFAKMMSCRWERSVVRDVAPMQEMPTSAQLFDYDLSISK